MRTTVHKRLNYRGLIVSSDYFHLDHTLLTRENSKRGNPKVVVRILYPICYGFRWTRIYKSRPNFSSLFYLLFCVLGFTFLKEEVFLSMYIELRVSFMKSFLHKWHKVLVNKGVLICSNFIHSFVKLIT